MGDPSYADGASEQQLRPTYSIHMSYLTIATTPALRLHGRLTHAQYVPTRTRNTIGTLPAASTRPKLSP